MDQRTQFIADYPRDTLTITELCQLYGVSRKTAYKWIDHYLRTGPPDSRNARDAPSIRPMRSGPVTAGKYRERQLNVSGCSESPV